MGEQNMTLIDLAARCENATGPDHALDRDILIALGWREELIEDIGEEPGCVWIAPGETHPPHKYPKPTASIDAAMTLVPEGVQLAIYTNWPLHEGFPQNPDGSWTITDEMPRGCWVRTYASTESGALKNVRGLGHIVALAISAIALRIIAATTSEAPSNG